MLSPRLVLAIGLFIVFKFTLILAELSLDFPKSLVYIMGHVLKELYMGIFPLFMLIGFGEAYRDDIKTGFYKCQIIKSSPRSYAGSKIIVLLLSLLIVAFVSYGILFSYLRFKYPLSLNDGVYQYSNGLMPIFDLEIGQPLVLVLVLVSFDSLYLTILSMGSFVLSLFLKSRLMLYMGPSLIFAFEGRIKSILYREFGINSLYLISRGLLDFGDIKVSIIVSYLALIIFIVFLSFIAYKKILRELNHG